MDIIFFLLGMIWVMIGMSIACEFHNAQKYDDDPPFEHEYDYWARMIGIVILWPILVATALVIVFFED